MRGENENPLLKRLTRKSREANKIYPVSAVQIAKQLVESSQSVVLCYTEKESEQTLPG